MVKDVDGLYAEDPKKNPRATFIPDISVAELRRRSLETLPFDEVLLDLLERSRLVKRFQIINGEKPELLELALAGQHVGSLIYAD